MKSKSKTLPSATSRVPVPQDEPAAWAEMGSKDREHTAITAKSNLMKDRKSTRLNSSHSQISYAVFCLKKKTDLGHKVVQFLYVSLSDFACSLRFPVCHADRDHAAFSIFINLRSGIQDLASILLVTCPVNLLQIKTVDHVVLHRPAVHKIDEERSARFHAQKISCERSQSGR